MGIEAKLDKLKDKLEDLIEEKTWYADANPILNVSELDLRIRLALYLIDMLGGKEDKLKNKCKLKADQQATDEKDKERKLLEEREEELKRRYKDWMDEQNAEAALGCIHHNNHQPTFVFVPFYCLQSNVTPKPTPALLENELIMQFINKTPRKFY